MKCGECGDILVYMRCEAKCRDYHDREHLYCETCRKFKNFRETCFGRRLQEERGGDTTGR